MANKYNCEKCSKKGVYTYIDKHFCENHFLEIVEKTVRRNFRKYKIQKNEDLRIDGSLAKYFVDKVLTMPYKISKKDSARVITEITLDDLDVAFLDNILNNSSNVLFNEKFINIFENLPSSVINDFCKIKNISFTKKVSKLEKDLSLLESKYPGTKNSLFKCVKQLGELK